MTPHRIELLEGIGFEWAEPRGSSRWEKNYKQLCEFHEKHGHANVPTKYGQNKALGRWITEQRAAYKKYSKGETSSMTPERVAKLRLLGFQFVMLKRGNSEEEGEGDSAKVSAVEKYSV